MVVAYVKSVARCELLLLKKPARVGHGRCDVRVVVWILVLLGCLERMREVCVVSFGVGFRTVVLVYSSFAYLLP